jgi:ATP adenylyltransferase
MEYFFNFDKLGYLKGERPEGCILCLVAGGSASVERLVAHETASFLVSLNLYPYNPGHLIVFPRRHVEDIRALTREERAELCALEDLSLRALDRALRPAAYNIGYNMGPSAGASIAHLHLHIIPRYPREIGIAELIGGARVLVQDPRETLELLSRAFAEEAAPA